METKNGGGDLGANKFSTTDEQVALLMGAIAESGNVSEFESLVKTNPCVFEDMAVRTANTPLHVAAGRGHLELVKAVMDRKPGCAEELNGDGVSPLHLAAESGHVEVVVFLLSRNTRLCSLRDCRGRTPLHCAEAGGKHRVVKALTEFTDYLKEATARGRTLAAKNKNKNKRVLEILKQVGTSDQAIMRRNRVLREGISVFQLAHSDTMYNQLIRSLKYYAEGMFNGRWNGRWYTLLSFMLVVYIDKQHMVGVMRPPIALLFLFMFFLRHIVRLLRPSIALVFFLLFFLDAIFRRRKSQTAPPVNYELPLSPPTSPPPSARVSDDQITLSQRRRSASPPPSARVTDDQITLSPRRRSASSPPSVRMSDDLASALGWVMINDPTSSLRRIPTTQVNNDLALSRRKRSASPRRTFPKSPLVTNYRPST